MKKMILMAVALLSMGTAFAGNDNANNAREAYVMNVNMFSLGRTLALSSDQVEVVEYISDNFCKEMYYAGCSKERVRQEKVNDAVRKNLKYMRSVLNREQYHIYVQVLNATLRNRDLM